MMLGIVDNRGQPKDTLLNLQRSGSCCIHLVERGSVEAMNQSSAAYGRGVSEVDALDLDTVPCTSIDGVRLSGARAAVECTLRDVHTYGNRGQFHLVVVEGVHAYIHDDVVSPDGFFIEPHKIDPVARLGGTNYAGLDQVFSLPRPSVPEEPSSDS